MKRIFIVAIIAIACISKVYAEDVNSQETKVLIKYHDSKKPKSDKGDYWKGFFEWNNAGRYRYYAGLGYVYSKGYPIGITVGSLRLGFTTEEKQYIISETEYRVPTWSIHGLYMPGLTIAGPIGLSVGLDLGLNMAERYIIDPNDSYNFFSKNKVYFSIAPVIGLDLFIFNAFVGYEFVPAFKDIQGLIWGVNVCFPLFNE